VAHTPEKSRPLASKLKRIYAPRVISDHIMVQEDFERLHKFLVETDGLSEGLSQFPSSAPGGSTRLSCGAGDAQLVLSQLSRQASPRGPRAGVFSFAAHTTRNQSSAAPGEDVMANLSIRELLLLTCIGTFIASATYAVTLLH